MIGRTDVQQYKNACSLIENFIPAAQGGLFRRPGTSNIALDATTQTYFNTFSGSNVPTAIENITSDGEKLILFASKNSLPSEWMMYRSSTNNFGTLTVTVEADVAFTGQINFTKVGDLILILDGSGIHAPLVWSNFDLLQTLRGYVQSFQYQGVKLWEAFPYLPLNAGGVISMTASAATGNITITSNLDYFSGTSAQWLNTPIKLSAAGSTGVAIITSRVSNYVVNATVYSTVPTVACGVTAGTSWEESAWSNKRYWPKHAVAHEGRLYYGGHPTYPDKVWASQIGNVFKMMERPFEQDSTFTAYPDDNSRAFTMSPNTQRMTPITGLSAGKTLVIHTATQELVASGTSGALGPLDAKMESSSSFGKSSVPSVRVDNYLTFVEGNTSYGRNIRELAFDFQQEQYKSLNLALTADHLTLLPDLVRAAGGGTPYDSISRMIACKLQNTYGLLISTIYGRGLWLSLDRDYNINAWSRIILGGAHGSSSQYQPFILDMCNLDGIVYLVVIRRINGSDVVQLEKFNLTSEVSYSLASIGTYGIHLDACKRFTSGTPTTSITGATHLIGQTVYVLADDIYVGTKVVDGSGNFTLSKAASNVIYGLNAPATMTTMPIELGQQIPDSSQGLMKRIDEVSVRFFNSYGAKIGVDTTDMVPINFMDPEAIINAATVMFSGIKTLKVPQQYSREPQVTVKQETPWPCNILSVVAKGVTYD